MPARASGSQPLHMQPFLAASKQNLRTQGKHPRAALPGGSVAHKRDDKPKVLALDWNFWPALHYPSILW